MRDSKVLPVIVIFEKNGSSGGQGGFGNGDSTILDAGKGGIGMVVHKCDGCNQYYYNHTHLCPGVKVRGMDELVREVKTLTKLLQQSQKRKAK